MWLYTVKTTDGGAVPIVLDEHEPPNGVGEWSRVAEVGDSDEALEVLDRIDPARTLPR